MSAVTLQGQGVLGFPTSAVARPRWPTARLAVFRRVCRAVAIRRPAVGSRAGDRLLDRHNSACSVQRSVALRRHALLPKLSRQDRRAESKSQIASLATE